MTLSRPVTPSKVRESTVTRRITPGLILAAAAAIACAADADNLVLSKRGDLPIILTAPHGGSHAVWGARGRTTGITGTDVHTLEFTEALAKRLGAILGAEPYVVAARFHRRYIDANRAEKEAFESAAAQPVYLAYHNQIRTFVAEIRQRFPDGALLLDIHGQGTDPDTVHRGTGNGSTVVWMVRQHGAEALLGEKSLFGVLQSKGRTVFPANTPLGNPPEDRRYNGGYTVRTYGSRNADGIDAIQLELGVNLRTTSSFVDDLAEAIAVYCRAYLLPGGRALRK